ncbi:MAG: ABC transporter permease [Chitinophagales bacterium]|nr:ABC transporter permease [Chitinophagales bacterium]
MLALRIAFRYLFSKKSTNAINVISWVSMLGMAVGALALIVVLSVFNGFEGLVLSLYNSFYPDIEVRAAQGKTFEHDPALAGKILQLKGVTALSKTLEENAYIEYGSEAQLATVKGVDENYNAVTTVKDYVRQGKFVLKDKGISYAVLGANLSYPMSVNVERGYEPLRITVPRKGVQSALLPEDAFTTMQAMPSGTFSIQQEFDSKYVFVSLEFAQELLGDEESVSAYEIRLDEGADLEKAKAEIAALAGNNYTVKTRYEQKAEMYRVMKIERWVTTAILGFIILIISFNIIGSLTMLVIEKSKDISILKAMGAGATLVQRVYLLNGLLASLLGAIVGLLIGYILCLLQLKYHFLKLGGGGENSFVINYYPVKLKWIDPFVTVAIITVISFFAAYFPSKRAGESVMSFK